MDDLKNELRPTLDQILEKLNQNKTLNRDDLENLFLATLLDEEV